MLEYRFDNVKSRAFNRINLVYRSTCVIKNFFSNHEIMRHRLDKFRAKYPELLQEYFDTLDSEKFNDDENQKISDMRDKVKLDESPRERAEELFRERLCPITICPFSKLQLDSDECRGSKTSEFLLPT